MPRDYPPLPYPRMPRYRVNKYLHEPWREVTDEELIAAGEDPAHYLPMIASAAKPTTRYFTRRFVAGAVAGFAHVAVVLIILHYIDHQLTTLELFGCFWLGGLAQAFIGHFLNAFMGVNTPKPTSPRCSAT